ncbi:DUF4265 domain-containing protein [Actinosynnema sp. NPDC023658]|uniref:DUF4265 domain-containing protein n=1 Tax=Actinosynnema sp. NPDC023658 TaxID=3155465 RepID=UPI0033DE45AB
MTEQWGDDRVKVVFDLPTDEDGWPPVGTEGLWAIPLPERDHVRLDNIPWFAPDVAAGDVVRVRADEDGVLRVVERVEWSGHCTIRLIVYRKGPLAGDRQRVLDMFAALGVEGEGLAQYGMVALDVPPEVDLAAVKRMLKDGKADEWWAYEEGCIGDAWEAAEA